MNEEIYKNGIAPDPRTENEKKMDYKHSDIYGTSVIWQTGKTLKRYTKRNQDGSLSCCGQGSAKGVETMISKVMSAHPPYRSRANFPEGGMFTQDIGATWYHTGSDLEVDDPSQNLHETDLNRDITVLTPYKIKGYLQPDSKKIDEIAQAIETWGHCMLIFHANGSEWTEKPVYNGSPVNFGHCICGVDYFLDENGKKCIWIEDSAALETSIAQDGHRVITEDYLIKRCDSAIYFLGVNPLDLPFQFTETLRVGSRGLQVKKLQEKIGVKVDGIFGLITKLAVILFQTKHGLVGDGIVGALTRASLNS
jgi:hypothetical protein